MTMEGEQSEERKRDLLAAGLIALVAGIIAGEEFLGWFWVKPVGGLLTLAVVGILGYVYFSG